MKDNRTDVKGKQMKEYTFFFLDGTKTTVKGNSVSDAFARAGYGGGAMGAIDVYTENDPDAYVWNGKSWTSLALR